MNSNITKTLLRLLQLSILLSLMGCGQEVLFTALPEKEANRIVALLQRSGIPSEKGAGGKGEFQITVDKQYFSNAVNMLDWYNFPSNPDNPMADIMKNKGLVTSPTMERMRYLSAKSLSVANSLEEINGIDTASVFLVTDLDVATNKASPKSNSASVFVKYRPRFAIADHLLDIKLLVLNSFADLALEDITLVTFPTYEWEQTSFIDVTGKDKFLDKSSLSVSADLAIALAIIVVLLILAVLALTVFKAQLERIPFLKKSSIGIGASGKSKSD